MPTSFCFKWDQLLISRIKHSFILVRIIFALSILLLSSNCKAQLANPFNSANTPYNEQNPILSPDGRALYFTIEGHPQNTGGIKDPGDIWVSLNLNSKWQSPINAGPILNDNNYNGVAGFNPDGSQLFLLSHYSKNNVTTQGFSVSQKTSSGWSTPENISIQYFLNREKMLSGEISQDGTVFIFSADSYNTIGGEDIYVSLKQNEKWSEPINLGKKINTPFQELSPSISEDLKTIYFASNGLPGLGSYDIFVSKRLDDTWRNWTTPINLGPSVNSEARELFFRKFPSRGFSLFTSTHDSNGYGDIRILMDSTFDAKPKFDTLILIKEKPIDEKVSNTVILSGKISNSKTKEGLAATLRFKSDSSFSVIAASNGRYKITIPSTKLYTIEVELKGYVNVLERLDIMTLTLNALEMNFSLQPIEVGTVVNLKSVLFYMGTTSLLEESYPELDAVVDFLKSNAKVEIQLEGHTDNRGDAKKNQALSQKRVERIKTYLVGKGISGKRVKGKGLGGTRPIASSDDEEARKLNRRVEFIITKG